MDDLEPLIRRIVALNTDGERAPSVDADGIARALAGSGVPDADLERALNRLVADGTLVRRNDGYALSPTEG
ncbi:hypothetical protein [Halocalculus aciditolerans]|uniref:Uncharacterized protein n=1 Tax=Halocalculus aciditolerans TaxID=1383812 RepID=A0A830FJX3_9EURY|nr:hypothetical protein [Halocalculus aciditolerans]GGL63767.1 hypothetical protein GCM10009039_22070 [Halocalculus aciditolerans]